VRSRVITTLILVMIFFGGSHLHDVGDIAVHANLRAGENIYHPGNGFFDIDAFKLYHTGWYMMYSAFIILILMHTHLLLQTRERLQ